jgi:hypothetical protein
MSSGDLSTSGSLADCENENEKEIMKQSRREVLRINEV